MNTFKQNIRKRRFFQFMLLTTNFLIASIANAQSVEDYVINNPKISIEKDSLTLICKLPFELDGKFKIIDGSLENIEDFRFSFQKIELYGESSFNLLEASAEKDEKIYFHKNMMMLLPVMKAANVIGDLKCSEKSQNYPLQLFFTKESDEFKFIGKLRASSAELGISQQNGLEKAKPNDVTIIVEFTLAKQPFILPAAIDLSLFILPGIF